MLLTLLTAGAVYLCQGLGLQRGEFLLNNAGHIRDYYIPQ